jgi:hypothetical protein
VLGVAPLEHADVDRKPGAGGELVQEPRHDVAREAADAVVREVDVRDDKRAVAELERGRRERLLLGEERPSGARGAAA